MDRIIRTRCHVCEDVFCCPDHRRKHEWHSHGIQKNKAANRIKPQKAVDSYALEMRKSFLYLEDKRTTIDSYGRKRKYVNVTKVVVEKTASQVGNIGRKILVPISRKKGNTTLEPKPDEEKLTLRDLVSPNQTQEEKCKMVTELISPVEHTSNLGDAKNFVSPCDEHLLDANKIFTTSTPITEKQNNMRESASTPLKSAKKSALRVSRGIGYMKRKVTFSETVDSLYATAKEETPENGSGLFTAVANVFQAAISGIAGLADGSSEESISNEECAESKMKRIRRQPGELEKSVPPFQDRIQGRRPLYNNKPSSRASLFR